MWRLKGRVINLKFSEFGHLLKSSDLGHKGGVFRVGSLKRRVLSGVLSVETLGLDH